MSSVNLWGKDHYNKFAFLAGIILKDFFVIVNILYLKNFILEDE